MGPDFRGLCLYWPSPMHLGRKPGQQVCAVEDALHTLANRKKRKGDREEDRASYGPQGYTSS